MKALVLAAGKSTRISPINNGIPKPLLKIGAKSVIERNLLWLESYGINEVWINLHYQPEQIKQHLGNGSHLGVNINYSFEKEILGTAGAAKKLQNQWDENFLIIYGDNFFNFDLNGFIKSHKPNEAIATVALFSISSHLNSGIAGGRVKVKEKRIIDFVEGASDYDLVNAGCYVCSPNICNYIPDDIFFDFAKDLFPKLLAQKIPLRAHVIDGYCLGLDDPDSYAKVKQLVEEKEIV